MLHPPPSSSLDGGVLLWQRVPSQALPGLHWSAVLQVW
jgi:hypothetical protein